MGYRAARIEKLVLIAIARGAPDEPRVLAERADAGVPLRHERKRGARRDQDLEAGGHIETMKVPGKGKVYRVLLGVEVTA